MKLHNVDDLMSLCSHSLSVHANFASTSKNFFSLGLLLSGVVVELTWNGSVFFFFSQLKSNFGMISKP